MLHFMSGEGVSQNDIEFSTLIRLRGGIAWHSAAEF